MENQQITGSAPVNAEIFPGVIDTLKSAWEIYKQRFWVIVKLVLIPIATVFILGAIGAIVFILTTSLSGLTLIIAIPVFVVFFIAMIVFSIWSQTALLIAIKDRQENIGAKESLRRAWPRFKSYF